MNLGQNLLLNIYPTLIIILKKLSLEIINKTSKKSKNFVKQKFSIGMFPKKHNIISNKLKVELRDSNKTNQSNFMTSAERTS